MEKIKVGAVSYLNTKPYIWGLKHSPIIEKIDLQIDYPARIAQGLIDGTYDIGLVPVAILPLLPTYHFISDYGIACDGPVASVALFSEVPLPDIETIQLDYHSRTSVALLKILLQDHWKISPRIIPMVPGEQFQIRDKTAALLIGDKALLQLSATNYVYDLGTAWKEMTGLPFVFAAWVSKEKQTPSFTEEFNHACHFGISQIEVWKDEVDFTAYNLTEYSHHNIHFLLDEEKKRGLSLFLYNLKPSR